MSRISLPRCLVLTDPADSIESVSNWPSSIEDPSFRSLAREESPPKTITRLQDELQRTHVSGTGAHCEPPAWVDWRDSMQLLVDNTHQDALPQGARHRKRAKHWLLVQRQDRWAKRFWIASRASWLINCFNGLHPDWHHPVFKTVVIIHHQSYPIEWFKWKWREWVEVASNIPWKRIVTISTNSSFRMICWFTSTNGQSWNRLASQGVYHQI